MAKKSNPSRTRSTKAAAKAPGKAPKSKAAAKKTKETTPEKATAKAARKRTAATGNTKAAEKTKVSKPRKAAKSAPPKARSSSAKPGDNGPVTKPLPAPKVVKTHLSTEELSEFRDMLMAKRRELVGDVTNLETEALRENGGGSSSSMPIHMADLGSDTWEQELTFGLIENERGMLREIDEALDRIENKTYGICLATHRRISKPRLLAKPWAKYCIAYARKKELGLA